MTGEADVDAIAFRNEVYIERARLAAIDQAGEADAVVPLSEVRARQTLVGFAILRAEAEDRRRQLRPADARLDGRELLDRLGVDPGRGRGVTRCPAHEDRGPSLSWRLATDGRALLHCFAGCTFAEILAAVA